MLFLPFPRLPINLEPDCLKCKLVFVFFLLAFQPKSIIKVPYFESLRIFDYLDQITAPVFVVPFSF